MNHEFNKVKNKVFDNDDINLYRTTNKIKYNAPQNQAGGYFSIPVLEFLKNTKLCNLTLSFIHSLNPSSIRVTTGEVTCDTCLGRVTVVVDENDIIRYIYQEVEVLYACGNNIDEFLKELKNG